MKKSTLVALLVFMSIFTTVTILPETARATTLYVGGTGPGNYTTIQGAINIAGPGDTVYVYNGTYNETVLIDRSLSLVGESSEGTVIDAQGEGDVLTVSSDWVNISGFTLRKSGYGVMNAGLKLDHAYHCTVANNQLFQNSNGIVLVHSKYNTVRNDDIGGNIHLGIVLLSSFSNIIADNVISSNALGGIYLDGSEGNLILENLAMSSGNGIGLRHSNSNTILSNNLTANTNGVYLQHSEGNRIVSNLINMSYGYGVNLDESSNNQISRNQFTLGDDYGVFAYLGHGNEITENDFGDNYGGIYVSSFSNSIYHNSFVENTYQSYDYNGSNQWDDGYPSGGNYWSDYNGSDNMSGPNQNQTGSDGIGDTPYNVSGGGGQDRFPFVSADRLGAGNQPPFCEITDPTHGAVVSDTYAVHGIAGDTDGTVEVVEVRIGDDIWMMVNGTTLWTYDWDTTTVSNGEYTLFARSFDGTNYSEEVSVVVVVDNPHEHGVPLLGQIFLWAMLALTISARDKSSFSIS